MRRFVLLLFAFLILFLFSHSTALAQVQVQIRAIRASNVERGIDPSLGDVYAEMRSLFSFTSYRLLREYDLNLALNQPVPIPLRPGRFIEFTLVGLYQNVVELRIRVVRERRITLDTQIRLLPGRTVLIGGPRVREGVIIYALYARF
jgi:hypothetical protein